MGHEYLACIIGSLDLVELFRGQGYVAASRGGEEIKQPPDVVGLRNGRHRLVHRVQRRVYRAVGLLLCVIVIKRLVFSKIT